MINFILGFIAGYCAFRLWYYIKLLKYYRKQAGDELASQALKRVIESQGYRDLMNRAANSHKKDKNAK